MKRSTIYVVVAVVVLGAIAVGLWMFYQNTGPKLLAKADLASRAGHFDRALDLVGRYLADHPRDWHGYYVQADAYHSLTQYEQARKSLEQAIKLNPGEVSCYILEAKSFAAEGRRGMAGKKIADIQAAVDHSLKGLDILVKLKPSSEQQSLDVLQELGRQQLDCARQQRWLINQLEEDALAAEGRRDRDAAQNRRRQIGALKVKSEDLRVQATKNLLEVVTRAPSRADAATDLVDLCLERQDDQSLAAARKAIMALDDPTPVAAMLLIMHELQSPGTAEGPAPVNRQKLQWACGLLDGILKRHSDNTQVRLARAELAMRLGDLSTTREQCEEILKTEPRNPRARLALAEMLILQGNVTEAELKLRDLKNDFPTWPDCQLAYARVALATGKSDIAQEALHAMAKIDSVSSRSKLMQAELAMTLMDVEQAKVLSEEVLRTQPGNNWARLVHGNAMALSGDLGQAERELRMLVKDYPKWPQAQLALAKISSQTGSAPLAIAAAQAAVDLDSENAEARKLLATLLLREGQYDRAFKEAQLCQQVHPDDPAAIRLFVEAAERTDKTAEARAALTKGMTDYKARPDVLMGIAEGYLNLNERASALAAAKLAVRDDAVTTQARLAVVRALMLLDRMPEAEKMLTDEVRKDPTRADLHFQMGQICAATGRLLPAIDQLREAVKIDRNNVGYRISLARALLDSGDVGEAGRELETVDQANPTANVLRLQIRLIQGERVDFNQMLSNVQGSERSTLSMAMPYLASGQLKQCVEFCQKELLKTPDDMDVRLLLGRALLSLGEQEKGIAQWEQVLRMAPDRLSTYLELASILSRDASFEKVAERMARIPGAQQDMVNLAIGRIIAASGDYEKATRILGQVVHHAEAPEHVRGRASILLAQAMAGVGRTGEAIAEFDKLTSSVTWRKEAMFGKAQLLAATRQPERFDAALTELRKIAQDEKDTSLLRNIAELYANNARTDRALEVCDDLQQISPNDPRNYRIRGAVLNMADRCDEAIISFNKAIELQPRNFSLYLAVAQILDHQEKSVEALTVLRRLEQNGPSAASIAMFRRGRFMASWGLQDQAAECFEKLSDLGFSGNPQVRLELGQAFALLGQSARADDFLRDIPSFAEEYVPARLIMARMAPDLKTSLGIIADLQTSRPTNASVLLEAMNVLIRSGQTAEALAKYQEFIAQPKVKLLPEEATYLAMQILLKQGQEEPARQLALRAMKEHYRPRWAAYAALLSLDADPAAAGGLLPPPEKADFYRALMGLYVARKTGDVSGQTSYLNRIAEIFRQAKSSLSTIACYQVLIDVAMGKNDRAKADLGQVNTVFGYGHSVAAELVNSAQSNPKAADEAMKLLKASIALSVDLPALANRWSWQVLEVRPTCQWAAVLATLSSPDLDSYKKLAAKVEPKNCPLALMLSSQILRSEKKYLEAADLLRQAAEVDSAPEITLAQAGTLEYAGKPDQALILYRKVYDASQDPNAANNVAYMILQTCPGDKDKLAEAETLIEKAIKQRPDNSDFLDTLGWINYLQGRYEQACQKLRKAIKGMPQSPEVHYHLGMAESACGRLDLARWNLAAAANVGKVAEAQNVHLTGQTIAAVKLAQKALAALGPAK